MIPLRDHLPTRRTPVVTYALIGVNLVAYLWQWLLLASGYRTVVFDYGLVPARLLAEPLSNLHTVLTSMFMHSPDTLWHLAGNMLFLWIFGDNVEDALGRRRFLVLYLSSGVLAALAQVAVGPSSLVPMVGASGAIAGVLAAYGSLYPRSPVLVLNPILPLWLFGLALLRLPAWVVIAEFFVVNLVSGLATLGGDGGGVAFFAHLGGFVAGLVLVRWLFRPRPQPVDPWQGWLPPRRDPARVPPGRKLDPWYGPPRRVRVKLVQRPW
jgi:membrane associated rhomboid family serine protease